MPCTPRLPVLLLATVVAAAAGCGGPLFSAEVEVKRFCAAQRLPTTLPATPAPIQLTTPPVAIPLEVPPGLRTSGSRLVLELLDGRLTSATPGVTLDGIAALDLVLQAGGGPVSVARYARPAGATGVTTLALAGQDLDVADMLQSGKLQVSFTVRADGPPPAATWEADLELCFHGKAVIPYF